MKLRTSGSVFGVALTLVLALAATRMSASAQEAAEGKLSSGNGKIVGVWDVRVTRRDCQTGDALGVNPPVMNMFNRGGTLLETAAGLPTRRGPGLGTWQYVGGGRYSAVFRFFRFNSDGSFAGTRRVARIIELSRDANEFTATATDELFDANGNLFQAGCATETATRLE
jgi:hypothetical protein